MIDPDRLFPAEAEVRVLARHLYSLVSEHPIISPHGHVSPRLLLDNEHFRNPAELFVTNDHYVTRMLHAAGLPLESLGVGVGVGVGSPAEPREVWRALAENWHLFLGTATGYWLTHELNTLFGLSEISADTADGSFDLISERLATEEFRPRALFQRFGINVLATTDDPLDDLSAHAALRADPTFPGRVLPTFRPDNYIDPASGDFVAHVARLMDTARKPADDYSAYLHALESRRAEFILQGAVSADLGVPDPFTIDLDDTTASALFRRAMAGGLSAAEARAFRGNMMMQMARMSVHDGLVMAVHAGVLRNHHRASFGRFGADTGHDIPVATEFTENLRPLLEKYGLEPGFHLVLFTVDEANFSRELAPLAGFYPSVYIGAPWWFLDAPDSILRHRAAVTETAGFYRGSGFIDDTRAFLSIPARHDMSRRLDAAFLARLVREGRLSLAQSERIVVDLVDRIPRSVFKL